MLNVLDEVFGFFALYHLNVLFHRYNVQWYAASRNTQKIILFLLQKGTKSFTVGVGGLFVGSLDCFASVQRYK